MDLTNDDVADILALLDSLPYDALDLRTDRFHLTLRRGPGGWTEESEALARPTDVTPGGGSPGGDGAGQAGGALRADEAPLGAAADADGLVTVVAPLPGTFYRAPRPGAPPFVAVGSLVGPDTVVCIIETMKLMNSVTAGVSGTVTEILLANAQFAEQDTVLMRIRADQ